MTNQDYFIHPSALCETSVGSGTRIWAWAHIMDGSKVGKNCNICDHCFVERGAIIGNDCVIKNGVAIWDGVQLLDQVFIGPNVSFTNDLYPRVKSLVPAFHCVSTLIGKGVSIGANSTIKCGIEIGDYSMIGAGSVVTRSMPPFSLVYGNPARHRGWVSIEGEKLDFSKNNSTIIKNGFSYQLLNQRIIFKELEE